jgi:hypothetical protein
MAVDGVDVMPGSVWDTVRGTVKWLWIWMRPFSFLFNDTVALLNTEMIDKQPQNTRVYELSQLKFGNFYFVRNVKLL